MDFLLSDGVFIDPGVTIELLSNNYVFSYQAPAVEISTGALGWSWRVYGALYPDLMITNPFNYRFS